MKITLALLGLAAAATAYPMFILEEEPLVRVARQLPQDRPGPLRRADDLQPAADTAYGGPPVSTLLLSLLLSPAWWSDDDNDDDDDDDDDDVMVQVGRVKIQVYRGPSKGDYDFAPWGYYNTQPADLAIHH